MLSTMPNSAVIEHAIAAFFQSLNDCNAKAYAAFFAEDGEFTNVFGQPATGRPAIEEFHAPMLREPQTPGLPSFVHATTTVLQTRVRLLRPEVAIADIHWKQTGAIAPNGQPWADRLGLMNLVFTNERGEWLIASMHNMDLPERPAKQ